MPKIYAPNRDYTGHSAGVAFAAGVGETDDPAALAYLARAGYGIGAPPPAADGQWSRQVELPPARIQIGTPLRDAATDPQPGDFLAPVNAGRADPHSPAVVAPEIHASPTGPIHPGDVGTGAPATQDAQETALAAATRVDGQDVGQATADAAAAATVEAPGANAKKADWVAYAESRGIPRAEAEDLSIARLRERLGV